MSYRALNNDDKYLVYNYLATNLKSLIHITQLYKTNEI